jgi:DNA processing protein
MTPAETLGRIRLSRTNGVGPITYRRLMEQYGTAAAALDALPSLARQGGRSSSPDVPAAQAIEREIEALARLGGRMLVLDGPGYPELLALLEDAPPVVSVLGDVGVFTGRAVAVVGGRNASANGQRMAEMLAADLTIAGLVVVSGMARGVDTAAHVGALHAGRTVAAVAGGLDMPYPEENTALQARIAASGAVIAEAPLGTAPQSRHFPRRNRIIAGLSLGVVVVEAAPRSGSLITARLAQEAGRDLFAVPGSPLDPRCRGSNDLIRQGATLTETAADVLDNLTDHPGRTGLARLPMFKRGGFDAPESVWEGAEASVPDMDRARRDVVAMLGPEPTSVDDLVRRCHLSASAVMVVLLELELAGRVETMPGHRVALLDATSPPRIP